MTVTNTGVLTVENTVSSFSTALVANPGSGDLLIKQLIGGTNVSITSTNDVITINASPGEAGVASVTNSPGVDIDLVTGTDSNPVIKQLASSAGISLQDTGTSVVVTNTDPGSAVELSSEGGVSLVSEGTGPNLSILGLSSGAGISLSASDQEVTIVNTSPASSIGLVSEGGTSLVSGGVGPNLSILGLASGTGISLSASDQEVTIVNTSPASSIGLVSEGGTSLVSGGVGPNLSILGLASGTGISLSASEQEVTIVNTSPASSIGLVSEGGTSLVSGGVGPNLSILGLASGTGISLSASEQEVTIVNTSPASSIGLVSEGGTSLVSGGVGPNLSILGLASGTGISLSASEQEVTIVNTSPASSIQLTNVGTTSLVPTGGGIGASPTLMGLAAGSNISLTSDDATNVTIAIPSGSFQPPTTLEALSVAGASTIAVTPTITVSKITTTGSSYSAQGTLASGTTDGFIKTVYLATSTVPFVLTVTSYVNEYGATVGPYVVVLPQAGSSVTLIWSATLAAWCTQAIANPPATSPYITISLDTNNNDNVGGYATQSGTTVHGVSTAWTTAYVGGTITWPYQEYLVGTVTQTGTVVTGIGTTWSSAYIGWEFYTDVLGSPIQVVVSVQGATQLTTNTSNSQLTPVTYRLALNMTPGLITAVASHISMTVNVSQTLSTQQKCRIYLPQTVRAVANNGQVIATGTNVGLGATSTTPAVITSAMAYLSFTGGTIYIRGGTYFINTPLGDTYSGTTVEGDGSTWLILGQTGSCFTPTSQTSFKRLNFDCMAGFGTVTRGPLHEWFASASGAFYFGGDYVSITNCIFNNLGSAITGTGPTTGTGVSHDVHIDSNVLFRCQGGQQLGGEYGFSAASITNCQYYQCFDDEIGFNNSSYCVAANNVTDRSGTIPLEGRSVTLWQTECCSVVGNSFRNIGTGAVTCFDTYGAAICGNTFYNCVSDPEPVGQLSAPYTSSIAAVIADPTATECTVTGNAFIDCGRAVAVFGQGCTVANNTYSGTIYPNIVNQGNVNTDTSSTPSATEGSVLTQSLQTFVENTLGASEIVEQTSTNGTTTGPWVAYTSTGPGFSTIGNGTEVTYGGLYVSLDLAIGYTGSTLPGCTLGIWTCNYENTEGMYYVASVTFTCQEADSTAILTIPRQTIPLTGIPASVGYYFYGITGPTGTEIFNIRAAPTATQSGEFIGTSGNEYDYQIWDQLYTPGTYMIFGDQGNNKGQLTLGPAGSPLSQIAMYNATGTFPSVLANSETVVAVTASGASTTDQIFISTAGALPVGLNVGGAYCSAANIISFKVINFTVTNYTNANVYSLWFQGISQ